MCPDGREKPDGSLPHVSNLHRAAKLVFPNPFDSATRKVGAMINFAKHDPNSSQKKIAETRAIAISSTNSSPFRGLGLLDPYFSALDHGLLLQPTFVPPRPTSAVLWLLRWNEVRDSVPLPLPSSHSRLRSLPNSCLHIAAASFSQSLPSKPESRSSSTTWCVPGSKGPRFGRTSSLSLFNNFGWGVELGGFGSS